MLDGKARKLIDPVLDRVAITLARGGLSANTVTWAGFVIGVVALAAISYGYFWIGAILIGASRICDGLDGAIAKRTRPTDYGGYLDIVLDFAFYGMIPLAFALNNPEQNALAALVLVFTFYANGASFLAYAIMAEKQGLDTQARGKKSLYFTTGLAEATETIAVFIAFCVFPDWFVPIAYGFAAICAYTTISRIILAAKTLN